MINYKLLRRVKVRILKEPRQFHMDIWFNSNAEAVDLKKIPNCGTAACIGGWALSIEARMTPAQAANAPFETTVFTAAAKALGLEQGSAGRLFLAHRWPTKHWTKYCRSKSATGRAKIAAARIDHFIKTKGAE